MERTKTTDLGTFFLRVEASFRQGVRFTDCAVDGTRLPRSKDGDGWEQINVVGAPLGPEGKPNWERGVSHTVECSEAFELFPRMLAVEILERRGCKFNDTPEDY